MTRTSALLKGKPPRVPKNTNVTVGTSETMVRHSELGVARCDSMQVRHLLAGPFVWTLGTKLLHPPTPLVILLGPKATVMQKQAKVTTSMKKTEPHY